MKAYIIGFEGKHRNPKLAEQLQQCGFEVVEENGAVDASGIDVTKTVDIPMFEALIGRYPLQTEVACAQAHLNSWRYLVKNNLTELAVFEDDSVFVDFDLFEARRKLQSLKGPWYVTLEQRAGDSLLSHRFIKKKLTLRRSLIQPRGNGSYIISNEAAVLGLRSFEKTELFDGVVDVWSEPSVLFRFFVFLPPAFVVDPGAVSTIGVRKSMQHNRFVTFLNVLKIIISPSRSTLKKLGLLKLKIFRPIKYLGTVYFLTAWYRNRFGRRY